MAMNYSFVAMYITQVFACVVGFIGLKKYKQFILPLRILEWYIISSIAVDLLVDIMIYKKIHTYWVGHCFNVLELSLYSGIFYAWRTSKKNGFLIWGGFVVYLLIWTIGKFSFESITGWDTYSGSFTQVIQIGFGGWLLLEIMKETNIIWKEDIRLWVLSGIVLYAAGTFIFFGLFTEMLAINRKLLRAIWPLNDAFIIMQYIFFLRAFLCKPANAGIINPPPTTHKERLK
jgi:hypothetical protein